MNAAQLADEVARLAQERGWTLVEHRAAGDRVALMFEANTSPYGAESSVHRAKARVAVATDVITAQLVEQGRQLASQREALIAVGIDPGELAVPIAPLTPDDPASTTD